MKNKKEKPSAARATKGTTEGEGFGEITNKAELKSFLNGIRDKMTEEIAAPIHALSAMNHVLRLPQIYDWLDNENKEIARDIWLHLRQSGLQLRNPPMLFGPDEEKLVANTIAG